MLLTLIRHGQSEGNAARLWQGQGNTPLTSRGRSQARALGARCDLGSFDRVFTSHLDRARSTASLAGFDAEPRKHFGEMDLGKWDGMTFEQVSQTYPEELAAMRAGEPVRWGETGETFEEFHGRVNEELDGIIASADDDDHILLIAHGGVNNTILRRYVAPDQPVFRVFAPPTNTGITHLDIDTPDRATLITYNDAGHLGSVSDWAAERRSDGSSVLDLIRHAVTQANLDARVQGQADWGLNDHGADQARRLGGWISPPDAVYTSSSGRAERTAELAFPGHQVSRDDRLMEAHMGEWQGRTWSDIERTHPGDVAALRSGARDVARGGSGETFADVQLRVTAAIGEISAAHTGQRVGVVSHGLALRAYLAGLMDMDHATYRTLGRLDNTAFSRVVITDDGPLISEFNITYHLTNPTG